MLEVELRYELLWEERGQRELSRLKQLLKSVGSVPPLEEYLRLVECLDVGTGKGVLLANLASLVKHIIGIDFSVEYVCFAQMLLLELGYDNWSLAVAEAEHLPLRDSAVGFVTALDIVEHMADQGTGISEAFRVLQPRGFLYLNSPNRYSLLAPEDHCRLWFVGLLPYKWQAGYVRWRAGRSYKGVRLLSYSAIKKALKSKTSSLYESSVMITDIGRTESLAEKILTQFRILLWILNSFPLRYITPSYHFLAVKK